MAKHDTYSGDDFPHTVEDWTDENHLEVIALCRNVDLAIAAWEAAVRKYPDRKIVARWGRGWTVRKWEPDPA